MLDLTNCNFLDIYGAERIPLEGEYSKDALTKSFTEHWIPFMECHKCGKSDYCKFALPHPRNEQKKQEIRCGVAETAIQNFVAHTFDIAGTLDLKGKQAYLDGAFY